MVKQARLSGVNCRLLLEAGTLDDAHRQRLQDYAAAGVQVRQVDSLPMKLAVFDARQGMIALLDPVITRPSWTAVAVSYTHLDVYKRQDRRLRYGQKPSGDGIVSGGVPTETALSLIHI